jgi:hypothetical protein
LTVAVGGISVGTSVDGADGSIGGSFGIAEGRTVAVNIGVRGDNGEVVAVAGRPAA